MIKPNAGPYIYVLYRSQRGRESEIYNVCTSLESAWRNGNRRCEIWRNGTRLFTGMLIDYMRPVFEAARPNWMSMNDWSLIHFLARGGTIGVK